jgi:hypothetical protein
VLEDAIQSYLANMDRSTRNRRIAFEEVHRWFRPDEPRGSFAFQTICDLLGIDSDPLIKGLESIRGRDLPMRTIAWFCAAGNFDAWPPERWNAKQAADLARTANM